MMLVAQPKLSAFRACHVMWHWTCSRQCYYCNMQQFVLLVFYFFSFSLLCRMYPYWSYARTRAATKSLLQYHLLIYNFLIDNPSVWGASAKDHGKCCRNRRHLPELLVVFATVATEEDAYDDDAVDDDNRFCWVTLEWLCSGIKTKWIFLSHKKVLFYFTYCPVCPFPSGFLFCLFWFEANEPRCKMKFNRNYEDNGWKLYVYEPKEN